MTSSPRCLRQVPEEMLLTLLQICGAVVLSGTPSVAPPALSIAPSALVSGQSTVSLNSAESVIFLGIAGDYKAMPTEELSAWLLEQKVVVVGESIRALGNADRRVWAVQCSDGKKLLKTLKWGLKKRGFEATSLLATALAPLEDNARALRAATREVEAQESKIWTSWGGGRNQALWVFHESSIDSKKIEATFRKTEATMSFFHQEFYFQSDLVSANGGQAAEASVSVDSLTESVSATMDCLKVIARDSGLAMDLYMRDMSSVLLLRTDNGRHQFFCPNVQESAVKRLQVPELNWMVTAEDGGTPFLE